jgi:hypothetical protein
MRRGFDYSKSAKFTTAPTLSSVTVIAVRVIGIAVVPRIEAPISTKGRSRHSAQRRRSSSPSRTRTRGTICSMSSRLRSNGAASRHSTDVQRQLLHGVSLARAEELCESFGDYLARVGELAEEQPSTG